MPHNGESARAGPVRRVRAHGRRQHQNRDVPGRVRRARIGTHLPATALGQSTTRMMTVVESRREADGVTCQRGDTRGMTNGEAERTFRYCMTNGRCRSQLCEPDIGDARVEI